jgi:invasion protein IalB
MHLRWTLVPSLLVAAALSAPAFAQQSAPADTATPAPPSTPAKKPHKPKPPTAEKPAAAAPAAAVAAPPMAGGAKPTLLSQYGEWGAYTASPSGKKVCFAIAKPSSSETVPADRPRNPSYMFISSRPADKVSNEVSIVIGYAFKPNSEATADVGTTSFALSTQQDGAWVKNATEEAHLVEALRAGQSAIVKGVSAKGTRSTDTFSLRGLAQALDRVDQECK